MGTILGSHVSNLVGQKMICRSKFIKMALRIFYWLTIFYDLSVPDCHELDRGQKHVKITSYNVLTWWQPTKLTHLVGSCFEVCKDCPRAFWLF